MQREIENVKQIEKVEESKQPKYRTFEEMLQPEYKKALEAGVKAFLKVHRVSPTTLAKFREALALELACYQDRGIAVSVARTETRDNRIADMKIRRPPLNRSR